MNFKIKMKKHLIDDLFAKTLAEHRQEPSQKTFEKFQSRLQEKHQKPKAGLLFGNLSWTYYVAAACIAIAISVGFLTQKENSVSPAAVFADLPSGKKNAAEIAPKVAINRAILSAENVQSVLKNINKLNLTKPKKIILSAVKSLSEKNVANQNPIIQQAPNIIVDDSYEEQNSVETNTAIFENSIVETTKPAEQISQGIFKTDIGESVVVVIEPTDSEVELIPSINPDSNISLAEVKRLGEEKVEKEKSFIAKLYSEYKHFKYGEKVDLKKFGIKDVLARVDDSVIKEDITDIRDFVQRKLSRLQRKD
jgi:hypothetical protein